MASTTTLPLWRVWAHSGKVRSSVLVRAATRAAARALSERRPPRV